jgi:hypothetical protein
MGVVPYGFAELAIHVVNVVVEPLQVLFEVLPDLGIGGLLQPILLHRAHVDELTATRHDGVQRESFLVGQGLRTRPKRLSKQCQGLRIDLVGLGQATGGLGEIPTLPRIDHCNGDLRLL